MISAIVRACGNTLEHVSMDNVTKDISITYTTGRNDDIPPPHVYLDNTMSGINILPIANMLRSNMYVVTPL